MFNILFLEALIATWLVSLVRGDSQALNEKLANPYKTYNDKKELLKIIKIKDSSESVLTGSNRISYLSFIKHHTVSDMREIFNSRHNLSSKLSGKILYFLTNGYLPFRNKSSLSKSPFVFSPPKVELLNLGLYSTESVSVTLRLRDGIEKAEILDIFPSSDQILIPFCSSNTLIRKPTCSGTIYDIEKKDEAIILNFKIVPKKIGLSQYRIYILCRINDGLLTVATISGQYQVNKTQPFILYFYNPHFIVRYGKSFYNYLWLYNNSNSSSQISEVVCFGNQAILNYPPNFKKKEFDSQPIPSEVRRRLEDSEPSFWLVPQKEERPIIEIVIYKSIPENKGLSDENKGLTSFINEDNLVHKSTVSLCEKDGNEFSMCSEKLIEAIDRPTQQKIRDLPNKLNDNSQHLQNECYDKNGPGIFDRSPVEPKWQNLETNIFKLQVDSKTYFFNIFLFFNIDISFWEHESLNMGVLCSRGLRSEVPVFASNRFGRPAILLSIHVENETPDFVFEVATFYTNAVILPFANEQFMVMKLLVNYRGKMDFALIKASLVAKLDVGGSEISERIPVDGAFHYGLFQVNEKGNFIVSTENNEHEITLYQKTGVDLVINKIEITENPFNDQKYKLVNLIENSILTFKTTFKADEEKKIMKLIFTFPSSPVKIFSNRFVVNIYTLENVFGVQLNFFYRLLLCSYGSRSKKLFHCDTEMYKDFGIITRRNTPSTRVLNIWNKTPINILIRKIDLGDPSPHFELSVTATNFHKKELQTTSVFSNLEFSMNPESILLYSGHHCELKISILVSKNFESRTSSTSFGRKIIFYFSDKTKFSIFVEFRFLNGRVEISPRQLSVNITYPGPIVSRKISMYSSFVEPIRILQVGKKGLAKSIVSTVFLNNFISPGTTQGFLEVSFFPSLLIKDKPFMAQALKSDSEICLFDLEASNFTDTVWNKIISEKIREFQLEVKIYTVIRKIILIKIKGSINYPNLIVSPLVLDNNSHDIISQHDLIIRNPFKEPMSFRLFLAKEAFLDIDKADSTIISYLRKIQPESDHVICMEHQSISSDNIKYFAKKLYSDSLNFVSHPRAASHSFNNTCFKFPASHNEREQLYSKFSKVNNFFFKFTQYNEKDFRLEFLSQNLIILDDILRFSFTNKLLQLNIEKKKSNPKTFFGFLESLVFSFINLFRRLPSLFDEKDQPSPIKKGSLYLRYTENFNNYKKEQNVFLSSSCFGKNYEIKPFSSITIPQALIVRKSKIPSSMSNEGFLIIKDNITNFQKVPIIVKQISLELVPVSRSRDIKEPLGNSVKDQTVILQLKRSNFSRRNPQSKTRQIPAHRPLIKLIEFKNNGLGVIYISKVLFDNSGTKSGCLELFKIKPTRLLPSQSIKVRLLVFFCMKSNSYYHSTIVVKTKSNDFFFPLEVHFKDFYVLSPTPSSFYNKIWNLQIAVLFLLLFFSVRMTCIRSQRIFQNMEALYAPAFFVPEPALKEKLMLYNLKTDALEQENLEKVHLLIAKKAKAKRIFIERNHRTIENDPLGQNEEPEAALKSRKSGNSRAIQNEKAHYSNINPVNELSSMSVEQICEMLHNDNSSSEEKHQARMEVISKAELGKDEAFIIAAAEERKFGLIGDKFVRDPEASNSSFHTDILNEISHSRLKFIQPTTNFNSDLNVYSLINKQYIDDEFDLKEDSQDFDNEVKEQAKLGKVFDIQPLIIANKTSVRELMPLKNFPNSKEDEKHKKPLSESQRTANGTAFTFRKSSDKIGSDNPESQR